MITALPNDAAIVGMGEDQARGTCHLFITSSKFKDVGECGLPSHMTAYFNTIITTGQAVLDKLDMSEALEHVIGCASGAHEYVRYQGLTQACWVCKNCPEKKEIT